MTKRKQDFQIPEWKPAYVPVSVHSHEKVIPAEFCMYAESSIGERKYGDVSRREKV